MFYKHFFLLIATICWSSTLIVSAQTTVYVPTAPCVGPGCLETKPTTTTNSVSPTRDSTTISTARPSDFQRTVVFINKQTLVGQDLFIRGGIDAIIRPGCEIENAETSPCAISINVNSLGSGDPYLLYDAYRINDTKLDWYGAQVAQGTYLGKPASGTPMAWTTNVPTAPEYQPLNKWGPHYWMTDFEMDCSQTEEGWFEVKAFLTNAGAGWEGDITQVECTGTGATTPPYGGTTNHLGRCGYVNVYSFSGPGCYIGPFDA